MAITFVGSNTQTANGSTAISLSLPASNPGDLVIVVTGNQVEAKGGPPSTTGYTAITDLLHTVGDLRLHVSYKFMGATPDTSVSVPAVSVGNCALTTVAMVFRGVNTTTPLDVAILTINNGAAVPGGAAAGITPINDNCCVVVMAAAANADTSVGSVSGCLPVPAVQISGSGSITGGPSTTSAVYQILVGGAGVNVRPGFWSTWTSGDYNSVLLALRPLTSSTDFNTVTKANVTTTGKTVVQRELVGISKYRIIYTGRTIGIPDSSVEAIFVDKYRIIYTGKTVNPIDTFRAVTVDKGSVLYRGRIVTPRDIQFEDIPRYRTKGLGSGALSVTR